MSNAGLDPREYVERLQGEHHRLRWVPLAPAPQAGRWMEHPMTAEAPLEYLHHHWVLPDRAGPPAGGWRNRMAARVEAMVYRVLQPYMSEERALLANLVQMNAALAERCDELAQVVADRQVAEAANQARLSAWLHAEVASARTGSIRP